METKNLAVAENAKEGEVIPQEKIRPLCPFYGFMGIPGAFIDNKGNACGLEFSHTPCAMEMAGLKPNWRECKRWGHLDESTRMESLLDQFKIFPDELHPVGAKSWEGIKLRGWYNLVLKK